MPDRMLPADLPPGRWVLADVGYHPHGAEEPAVWVSDEPVPGAALRWSRLYARHPVTGLYPLLLGSSPGDPDRPWHAGELTPFPPSMIDDVDVEGRLRHSWEIHLPGRPWPGLAPATPHCHDPDSAACAVAGVCASQGGRGRRWLLGLVPARSGAEALSVCGWPGPVHQDFHVLEISAVIRSWEERFGARVVAAGVDTLDLSFGGPPTTKEQARAFAAELIAFCPAGFAGYSLTDLVDGIALPDGSVAGSIVAQMHMSFWWG